MTGDELRAVREALGLTQEAMGCHIGVTRNTVARLERGEMRITEPMERLIRIVSIILAPPRPAGPKGRRRR